MTIDANTLLLLACDGGDGNTTFVDTSFTGHNLTTIGDTVQKIDQFKFDSGSSAFFDGTGDEIEVDDSPLWDFLTSNFNPFTIDMWVRFTNVSSHKGFMWQDGGTNHKWGFYWGQLSKKLTFKALKSFQNQTWEATWNPVSDQWYHIAVVRDSSNNRFIFVDGIPLTLTIDTTQTAWSSGASATLNIGHSDLSFINAKMAGWMDEIRISDVARWTTDFTPPTIPYGEVPPPPPPEVFTIDKWNPKYDIPRIKKPPTNPGDFDVAGLDVPVPIKMDKWQNLSQPPARIKPVNPANTTQIVFVDFTVPTLPDVLITQWLNEYFPRKPKPPRILPTAFATSQIAAINPINGNFFDSGVIRFDVTVVNTAEEQTYADRGVIGLTITGKHIEDFQLEDTGVFGFLVRYPETGVEAFNSGVPGFVSANVIVNGINRSNFIQGVITVTREDNAAARFQLSVEEDPDETNAPKPIEFINKIITINFAAAGMDGVVSDYIPIFVGIVKGVSFNEDMRTVVLSGYDYSGIHQTRGEYVSENITEVLTGSIGAGSATTLITGHSPIWGVVWNGSDAVKDGQDFFVDTLNGEIIIPVSSRILQFPGAFTYNYANHFNTMKDIIQAVVSEKNWIISEDRVAIADYTTDAAHPVLSLSDESIIDTTRKFLELSGAKLEGNLFPNLRIYSEVENWINPVDVLILDENIIFENSLNYEIDFDNLLNEQTTRSVQRVNANIVVRDAESIAEFTADSPSTNPFNVQNLVTWVWNMDLSTPTVLAEHRIAKQGLHSISVVSSGRFHLTFLPEEFEESISGSSWNVFVDGDDFVLQLSHNIVVLGLLNVRLYAYPAFEYSLTVNGSKIEYGGGNPEDVRVVTSQRPIGGVTDTLKGDVYENPYIETDTHCANINNAVLLEHGNPYTAQFEIPIFEGKTAQIGNRVDIKRDAGTIFSGIIKRLSYQMNNEDGANKITVTAKGIGKGI